MAPFLPLIPETRNLRRFLVSGINGKNGAMGFFSDHLLSPISLNTNTLLFQEVPQPVESAHHCLDLETKGLRQHAGRKGKSL